MYRSSITWRQPDKDGADFAPVEARMSGKDAECMATVQFMVGFFMNLVTHEEEAKAIRGCEMVLRREVYGPVMWQDDLVDFASEIER